MRQQLYLVFVLLVIQHAYTASVITCPSTAEGNVLIPHQFECSCFFLCDGSGPKPSFLLRCPMGFYFNNVSLSGACTDMAETRCEPQIEVNFVRQQRTYTPLPPIDSPQSYRNSTMHLPNPRKCNQFYRHEGWMEPKLYECPDNLQFDPVLEICDLAEEVDCGGRECQRVPEPQCPPTNESVVHLPHPTDCGAYYVCNWGEAILKHCPDNLYFNPELGVCDWPRNVYCNRCPPDRRDNELRSDARSFTHSR